MTGGGDQALRSATLSTEDRGRLDQVLVAEVPAAIAEVGEWSREDRAAAAEVAVDAIAGGADALLAPGGTSMAPAAHEARAALTRGLAILAQREEGVSFGGVTWTADGRYAGEWSIPAITLSRAARGAHFTPRAIAETVANGALSPLTRGASAFEITQLTVADIACGAGAFLVAAARHLAQALAGAWESDEDARDEELWACRTTDVNLAARVTVLDACINGLDVDPLSAELARVALQLLVPDRRAPWAVDRIRVGDALVGEACPGWRTDAVYPPGVPRYDWPAEYPYVIDGSSTSGFSAVIGNPPYLGGQKLTAAFGKPYREHLVKSLAGGARGSADLAAYFTIRAVELCQDLGVVGLITTNTLLQGATARVLAAGLNALGWQVHRCEPARWPGEAEVECMMVWLHRTRAIPEDLCSTPDELRERLRTRPVPYRSDSADPYALWRR